MGHLGIFIASADQNFLKIKQFLFYFIYDERTFNSDQLQGCLKASGPSEQIEQIDLIGRPYPDCNPKIRIFWNNAYSRPPRLAETRAASPMA